MKRTAPTSFDNLICLCPNHHALLDLGGFLIADNLTLIGIPGQLSMHATTKSTSITLGITASIILRNLMARSDNG